MKQDLIDKAEAALAGYRGALALGFRLPLRCDRAQHGGGFIRFYNIVAIYLV